MPQSDTKISLPNDFSEMKMPMYKCSTCGKMFSRRTCFERHEDNHAKNKEAIMIDRCSNTSPNQISTTKTENLPKNPCVVLVKLDMKNFKKDPPRPKEYMECKVELIRVPVQKKDNVDSNEGCRQKLTERSKPAVSEDELKKVTPKSKSDTKKPTDEETNSTESNVFSILDDKEFVSIVSQNPLSRSQNSDSVNGENENSENINPDKKSSVNEIVKLMTEIIDQWERDLSG